MTPVQRFLPPEYADGLQAPRVSTSGAPLPSAREISAAVHEDRRSQAAQVTHLLMQWGQFIDHDLTASSQSRGFNGSVPRCCRDGGRGVESGDFLHPECLPIPVLPSDPFYRKFGIRCLEFLRSSPASRQDCELGWREQINQVTAYLDASPLYGSSVRQSDNLRLFRNGMLQYGRVQSRKPLLPPEREDKDELCHRGAVSTECFKSGDNRVNEHPGLVAMHIVWLRMHNRMANELAHLNSHWSDEKIYQETRKIIGALVQHVTFNEFLPIVVGAEVMRLFDLKLLKKGFYRGYSRKVNASPGNAFGAAAFRFGHSLVQPSFMRYNRFHEPISGNITLHEEVSNPDNLWSFSAVDHLLTGMLDQPSQKRDEFITDELTNHLFQTSRFRFGMDLAAINIQRGRDHGLPPYITWREPCGLTTVDDWSDLYKIMSPRSVNRLQDVYRHVGDIDLFTGGMCERPVIGGLVGPTFACIIAQQFSNIRKGDRFWYENGNFESSFTPAQLQNIRRVTMAHVLCRALDSIITIQPFVFLSADDFGNERLPCDNDYIENFELSPWIERRTDIDNNIPNFDRNDRTTEKPLTLLPLNENIQIKSSLSPNTTKVTSKPSQLMANNEKVALIDNKLNFDLLEHKLPSKTDDNDNTDTTTTEQHKLDDKLDFRKVKTGLDITVSPAKRYFELDDNQQGSLEDTNTQINGKHSDSEFKLDRPWKRQRTDSNDNFFYTLLKENLNYENDKSASERFSIYEIDKHDNSQLPENHDIQTDQTLFNDRNRHYYKTDDMRRQYQYYNNRNSNQRRTDDYQTDLPYMSRYQYQSDRLYNLRPIKVTENNNRFTYLVNIVPKTTPKYHDTYREPIKITCQSSFPNRYQYPNPSIKSVYKNNKFVQRPLTQLNNDRTEYKNYSYFNTDDNKYEQRTKYQTDYRTTKKPLDEVRQNTYKGMTNEHDSSEQSTEINYRLITFNHVNELHRMPDAVDQTTMTSFDDYFSLQQDKTHNRQQTINVKTDHTDSQKIVYIPAKNTLIHKGIVKDNIPLPELTQQKNELTFKKQPTVGKTVQNRQTTQLDFYANLKQDELTPNTSDTVQSDYVTNTKLTKQTVPELIKHDEQNKTLTQFNKTVNNLKTILNDTLELSNMKLRNLTYDSLQNRNDSTILNKDKYYEQEKNDMTILTSKGEFDNIRIFDFKQNLQDEANNFDKRKTLTAEKTDSKFVTYSTQDPIKQLTKDKTETNNIKVEMNNDKTETNNIETEMNKDNTETNKTKTETNRDKTETNKTKTERHKDKTEKNVDTVNHQIFDATSVTTLRYFYINNVLHKYPQPNMADYDTSPNFFKKPTVAENRQNLTVFVENYNNPWKKGLTNRVEFSGLNTSSRAQTNIEPTNNKGNNLPLNKKENNSQRSNPHTKLQELINKNVNSKKGNIHVGFQVIPSENSPNLWMFYNEQEENFKVPLRAMPQINNDPHALKEFPRPIDFSIIQNYKKKTRPSGP